MNNNNNLDSFEILNEVTKANFTYVKHQVSNILAKRLNARGEISDADGVALLQTLSEVLHKGFHVLFADPELRNNMEVRLDAYKALSIAVLSCYCFEQAEYLKAKSRAAKTAETGELKKMLEWSKEKRKEMSDRRSDPSMQDMYKLINNLAAQVSALSARMDAQQNKPSASEEDAGIEDLLTPPTSEEVEDLNSSNENLTHLYDDYPD